MPIEIKQGHYTVKIFDDKGSFSAIATSSTGVTFDTFCGKSYKTLASAMKAAAKWLLSGC